MTGSGANVGGEAGFVVGDLVVVGNLVGRADGDVEVGRFVGNAVGESVVGGVGDGVVTVTSSPTVEKHAHNTRCAMLQYSANPAIQKAPSVLRPPTMPSLPEPLDAHEADVVPLDEHVLDVVPKTFEPVHQYKSLVPEMPASTNVRTNEPPCDENMPLHVFASKEPDGPNTGTERYVSLGTRSTMLLNSPDRNATAPSWHCTFHTSSSMLLRAEAPAHTALASACDAKSTPGRNLPPAS